MDNADLVLLLSVARGVGPRATAEILRLNAVLRRSAADFLALSAAELMAGYALKRDAADAILAAGRLRAAWAAETVRSLRAAGIMVLTITDATYPSRLLRGCPKPPPVVYAFGALEVLAARVFAVANSNDAGEEDLAAADRAAAVAIEEGWTPVTGHNRIPYQRTALVARRQGARVCYVMDRGLRHGFGGDLTRDLFAAARIWNPAYDPSRDLAISAFGPDDHGSAGNNRRRDELVFALADAVIAGYLKPGGVMQTICREAEDRGVPVLPATSDPDAMRAALRKAAGASA